MINLVANITITVSVTLLIISLFGHSDTVMKKFSIFERILARVVLSIIAADSFFDCLSASSATIFDATINVVAAILFTAFCFYHWKHILYTENKL